MQPLVNQTSFELYLTISNSNYSIKSSYVEEFKEASHFSQ